MPTHSDVDRPAGPLTERPRSRPDEVSVLVFKDNDTSRGFQVSLAWIRRLGFAAGALTVSALLGAFFSVKFYRISRQLDPARVPELEQRLADLAVANKGLEAKLSAQPVAAAQTASNPMPVPTVTVTVTAAPAPVAAPAAPVAVNPVTPTQSTAGAIPLFSALPRGSQDLSASAANLPISVSPAHTSWSGRTFRVAFDIQYTGTDRGSQQGRIVVLARGANALFAYPQGVLSRAGSDSLINSHQGEYFSVSRFREVKAEFPEIKGTGPIHDVEILILSLESQLLFYQKIVPGEAAAAASSSAPKPQNPAPAAKPAVAPPATGTAQPGQPKAPASKPAANPPAGASAAVPAPGAQAAPAAPAAPKTPTKPPARPKSTPAAKPADSSELIEPGVDQ